MNNTEEYMVPCSTIKGSDGVVDHSATMLTANSFDTFDYLYFAAFLYRQNIRIIPPSELISSSKGTDMGTLIKTEGQLEEAVFAGGSSMWVVRGILETKNIVFKVPRGTDQGHDWTPRKYNKLMYDLFFEMQIMSHKPLCDHRNIVQLLGLSLIDIPNERCGTQLYPILVVEAADSEFPDLQKYVRSYQHQDPMPLNLVFDFVTDIADGLTALHVYGIVHGDIKPANILLFCDANAGRLVAKLGDFGSCGVDSSNDIPRGATAAWAPPEYDSFNLKVGEKTRDIYSFGLVCAYIAGNGKIEEMDNPQNFDWAKWNVDIRALYNDVQGTNIEPFLELVKGATREVSQRICSLSEAREKLFPR
jgi:serine/threonine protein kinase